MKKYKYITGIALAATMLTACSGLDDDDIPVAEQTVPVTFYIRAASPATRVTEYTEEGTTAENTIHTAKVWLYRSAFTDAEGAHEPLLLGYRELTGNGDKLEGTINVAKSVIEANRKVDIYAVGNAESAGLGTMNAGSNFATSYLGGTNFVPATRTTSAGVPDAGLPMSQIAMNKTVYVDGSGPNYYIDGIDMVRAISKVRFAFARSEVMDDVKVMAIEIDGNLIPNQERIFPKQTTDNGNYALVDDIQYNGDRYTNINTEGGYDANMTVYGYAKTGTPAQYSTPLLTQADIMPHVWPKWFDIEYAGVTGEAYEERIDSLLTADGYTNYDFTTYLRESDKAITGRIWYRVGYGVIKSAEFEMDFPQGTKTAEDFARNHIYTVYAYFSADKLEVKPIVQKWDWEADHDRVWLSQGPIEISIYGDEGKQSYKMFNPTPTATNGINWSNAYVGIYYGVETDPEEPLGMPLYSPMLHLSTAYKQDLTLYSSNPNFGFITMTMVPKTNENPYGRAYSQPMASVTIPAYTGPNDVPAKEEYTDTYFYVVPLTEQADIATLDYSNLPPERITHIYLLDPDGYKQPINPSFMPGPNNNQIWFFYMNSLSAYHALDDYHL